MTPPTEGADARRVTFNQGPDIERGFDPGDRLVYRSKGLTAFPDAWVILSVPAVGGSAREEAGVYRQALLAPPSQLLYGDWGRVLVTWVPPVPNGADGCRPPAPQPPVVGFAIYHLAAADTIPLASVSVRAVTVPAVEGRGTLSQRVRIPPSAQELDALGSNPFGPTIGGDGVGFYSDGETLWRFDLLDPAAPAESVGVGAFPALSPSGDLLAAAVPIGVDSTTDTTYVPVGLGTCVQETVRIAAAGWEIELHDLASGTVTRLSPGIEPRFDPLSARVLVRRDALYWVPLGGGSSEVIPNTEGAHSAAISPDGSLLAFSTGGAADADVYVVRIR